MWLRLVKHGGGRGCWWNSLFTFIDELSGTREPLASRFLTSPSIIVTRQIQLDIVFWFTFFKNRLAFDWLSTLKLVQKVWKTDAVKTQHVRAGFASSWSLSNPPPRPKQVSRCFIFCDGGGRNPCCLTQVGGKERKGSSLWRGYICLPQKQCEAPP